VLEADKSALGAMNRPYGLSGCTSSSLVLV